MAEDLSYGSTVEATLSRLSSLGVVDAAEADIIAAALYANDLDTVRRMLTVMEEREFAAADIGMDQVALATRESRAVLAAAIGEPLSYQTASPSRQYAPLPADGFPERKSGYAVNFESGQLMPPAGAAIPLDQFYLDPNFSGTADPQGTPLYTFDGVPLNGRFIFGTTSGDGTVIPGTFDQFSRVGNALGYEVRPAQTVPGESFELPPNVAGRTTFSRHLILYQPSLQGEELDAVTAHEVAHAIFQQLRAEGSGYFSDSINAALGNVYNEVNLPADQEPGLVGLGIEPIDPTYVIPEHYGYRSDLEREQEFFAEAVRLYVTNRNWLWQNYPDVARAVALQVNASPGLQAAGIQFN